MPKEPYKAPEDKATSWLQLRVTAQMARDLKQMARETGVATARRVKEFLQAELDKWRENKAS